MSKSGVLGTLLPVLGGVAALGTGLGAAGIGPLAGLFSAGDAAGAGAGAADAALTAGTGVADAGAAALPATAGALPGALDAGSFLIPGTDTALAGAAPIATGSAGDFFTGATPAIGSLGGDVTPATQLAANTAPGVASDIGPGVAAGGDFMFPGTSSPFAVGTPAGDVSSLLPGTAPLNAVSDAGAGGFSIPGTDIGLPGGSSAGTVSDVMGDPSSSDTPWWKNPNNLLKLAPLGLFGLERLMNPSGLPPGAQPVQQAAQTAATNEGILTGQGQQNMSFINTGAVPAGAQAAIDQAANAAKAQVRSAFAGMGVPPGSSMEAQQLAAVDQNTAAQKFDIESKLLQSGISQFNSAGAFGNQVNQVDLALMKAKIQQEQELEQALAGFAGATAASGGLFSGGTGTT